MKKTNLDRYGSETFVNPEKAKITCLKRYGVDNASKSPEIIERIKKSNQKKYGVDWSWQNEDVKIKIRQTNLKKYGAENPSSSDVVKKKRSLVVKEKFGVNNVFEDVDIQKKIKETNQSKYGVDYYPQSEDFRKKMAKFTVKNFFSKLHTHKLNEVVIPLFSEHDYVNTNRENRYKFQCKQCGGEFYDHIDGGHLPRCLTCNPYIAGFSKGEKEIVDYLRSILPDEEILEKNRDLLGDAEVDIYLPSKKLAIEFNGLFWHSENGGKKDRYYHINKTQCCNNRGIRLLHIFEDEWLTKSDIVKTKLRSICGVIKSSIYARNCKVVEIPWRKANDFMEKYHIQGSSKAGTNIGLYHDDELVVVATFGKLRKSLGSTSKTGEFELIRYATSTHVVGGCGKLLSYFVGKYKPRRIISYADRRWSGGRMYEKIGFVKVAETVPNYHYFVPGYSLRYHRFGFRKDQLSKKLKIFDSSFTEWENMQINGYDRIWDCGNLKYQLSF